MVRGQQISIPDRKKLVEPFTCAAQNVGGISNLLKLCLGADEEFVDHGAFGMMPTAPGHDDQGQLDRIRKFAIAAPCGARLGN